METVYAAMLLHKAGKPIDENHMEKLLSAIGLTVDKAKIKATVAALKDVNIDKVIKEAVAIPAQAAPATAAPAKEEKKKEEKKEEKKSEEEAAAGLGALFG